MHKRHLMLWPDLVTGVLGDHLPLPIGAGALFVCCTFVVLRDCVGQWLHLPHFKAIRHDGLREANRPRSSDSRDTAVASSGTTRLTTCVTTRTQGRRPHLQDGCAAHESRTLYNLSELPISLATVSQLLPGHTSNQVHQRMLHTSVAVRRTDVGPLSATQEPAPRTCVALTGTLESPTIHSML